MQENKKWVFFSEHSVLCTHLRVFTAVEMASPEPVTRIDGLRRISWLHSRLHRADLQSFRGDDHVHLVPRRRPDAHTQDADTSAHRVQSDRRCARLT